jgi:hypothetical protein
MVPASSIVFKFFKSHGSFFLMNQVGIRSLDWRNNHTKTTHHTWLDWIINHDATALNSTTHRRLDWNINTNRAQLITRHKNTLPYRIGTSTRAANHHRLMIAPHHHGNHPTITIGPRTPPEVQRQPPNEAKRTHNATTCAITTDDVPPRTTTVVQRWSRRTTASHVVFTPL